MARREAPPRDRYVDFLVEQFTTLGPTMVKAMFGGYGFYCGGLFFALYDKQHVYLKVDAQSRPAFEARGLPAFRPFADKPMTMSYHLAPAEMFEDESALRHWVGLALDAARRARKK